MDILFVPPRKRIKIRYDVLTHVIIVSLLHPAAFISVTALPENYQLFALVWLPNSVATHHQPG